MKYVIDGYNFLFHLLEGENLEKERLEMLNLLNALAKKTSLELIIVFDSHSFNEPFQRERFDALEVQYTDFNQTADEHIVVLTHYAPKEITVVTLDKHLSVEVRQLGAKVLKVHNFYNWLVRRARGDKRNIIPSKEAHTKPLAQDKELERYLRLFQKRFDSD